MQRPKSPARQEHPASSFFDNFQVNNHQNAGNNQAAEYLAPTSNNTQYNPQLYQSYNYEDSSQYSAPSFNSQNPVSYDYRNASPAPPSNQATYQSGSTQNSNLYAQSNDYNQSYNQSNYDPKYQYDSNYQYDQSGISQNVDQNYQYDQSGISQTDQSYQYDQYSISQTVDHSYQYDPSYNYNQDSIQPGFNYQPEPDVHSNYVSENIFPTSNEINDTFVVTNSSFDNSKSASSTQNISPIVKNSSLNGNSVTRIDGARKYSQDISKAKTVSGQVPFIQTIESEEILSRSAGKVSQPSNPFGTVNSSVSVNQLSASVKEAAILPPSPKKPEKVQIQASNQIRILN